MSTVFLMYHFINGPKSGPFTGLKGVPLPEFKQQITWLCRHMEPLTHQDLLNAAEKRNALPDKSFHLSFDDGTRDHIDYVFPVLQDIGLTASFFPVTQPLVEGKVLTVEKQRYLHYVAYSDYDLFLEAFFAMILQKVPDIDPEIIKPSKANILASKDYLAEFEFYTPQERFYRKIRNEVLSRQQFATIVDAWFAHFYPDEQVFIDQFYMSFDHLRDLQSGGMTIGGHTHNHPFLSKLAVEEAERDIKLCLSILSEELGRTITAFAYPYGDFNSSTIKILEKYNLSYAFATGNRILTSGAPFLALPRLDATSFDKIRSLV